jgi:phospholipid-translocating ATPase
MLWANTVLAVGSAIGFVMYTGAETRAVLNTSHPETKVGLLDWEINRLAKVLCAVTFALAVVLVALNGFRGEWYIYIFRFLILFSSIIPISLRVNVDMGKTVYAHLIMNDVEMSNTIVRTGTLPEELGRITYLLSDKRGTLTQNGIFSPAHSFCVTMTYKNLSRDGNEETIWEQCRMALTRWMKSLINWLSHLGPQ